MELYNHVARIYKQDSSFFEKTISTLESDLPESSVQPFKPLGRLGDYSINELLMILKDLEWSTIIQGTKLTIQAVPFCMNFIGYGLILRSYVKFVYNRPYPENLTAKSLNFQKKVRSRNLAVFAIVGAPLALAILRKSSNSISQTISVELPNNFNKDMVIDTTNPESKGFIFFF